MIKRFFLSLATIFILVAFFFPMTALAGFINETIESEDVVEDEINADEDDASLEASGEWDTLNSSRPFTPDGQATVIDFSYEDDGKAFYTFKTPDGNVFYLVIDNDRAIDNVYFLNAVTEDDLLALSVSSANKTDMGFSSIPSSPSAATEVTEDEEVTDTAKSDDENPPDKSGGNMGTVAFALIGVLAVGGAGYYVKVVQPRQQDVYDDVLDEDDEAEMEFEDEPEEDEQGEPDQE